MSRTPKNTGFAIAIAWPETYCKQPGYWYDSVVRFFGYNTNHYYKVGHAALVLINNSSKKCFYYDFGRYHTPFKYGRVRSVLTDAKLEIKTAAQISENRTEILNFADILTELQLNAECHGEGPIHASYAAINFEGATQKAQELQNRGAIPYGPFKYKGSNCSRFVRDSIFAGNPLKKHVIRMQFPVPFTPTPMTNVNGLNCKTSIAKLLQNEAFIPAEVSDKTKLKFTLQAPIKPNSIPAESQWLSGEGAGSWFYICMLGSSYEISRFGPKGDLECKGNFKNNSAIELDFSVVYEVIYLSHCKEVNLKQNGIILNFSLTS